MIATAGKPKILKTYAHQFPLSHNNFKITSDGSQQHVGQRGNKNLRPEFPLN